MKAFLKTVVIGLANLWFLLTVLLILLWLAAASEQVFSDQRWLALTYLTPFWFILLFLPPIVIYLLLGKFKRSAVLFIFYLVFFIGCGDVSLVRSSAFQFENNKATQSFDVIALNLRYYSFGFDAVIKGINEMDADLYLLSENRISDEQLLELRRRIAPMHFYMGQQDGTAIISRYPVLSFKEVKFPTRQAELHRRNKFEEMHRKPLRSFVHAIIDVNGTPLHAISVRFIAGRARSRELDQVIKFGFYFLQEQQKEIAFFQDYMKTLEGPVIFGGDLNATPSSVVIQKINTFATDLYLQDHLWGGITFGTNFPPKTNVPIARLDYIFAMNEVEVVRTERLDTVISDHYPVYAECRIPHQPEE